MKELVKERKKMIDDKKLRADMKKLFPNYDTALEGIETLLGQAASMALFIGKDLKEFVEIPPMIKYNIGIVAHFMLAWESIKQNSNSIPKIQSISHIEDINEKLDIVLSYLEEVILERKKER